MTKRPLLAIVLSVVIAVSLIAFIQLEKNSGSSFNPTAPSVNSQPTDQFRLLTFPVASFCTPVFSVQPAFEVAKEAPLLASNSTRAEIYSFIVSNPGIQFRGICTGLGIAIGTAEFHLGVLKKAGLVSSLRDGKYKRFFASRKFSVKEMKLLSLLRHETVRDILKTLAAEKAVSHGKLASDLAITSQGLTWQMNRLREEGVIEESYDAMRLTYSLNEAYVGTLPELLCMVEHHRLT